MELRTKSVLLLKLLFYNNNPSKLLGLFFIAIIILQIKNTLVNNITKVSNKILD